MPPQRGALSLARSFVAVSPRAFNSGSPDPRRAPANSEGVRRRHIRSRRRPLSPSRSPSGPRCETLRGRDGERRCCPRRRPGLRTRPSVRPPNLRHIRARHAPREFPLANHRATSGKPFCLFGYAPSIRVCNSSKGQVRDEKAAGRPAEEASGLGGAAAWGARGAVAAGDVRDGNRFRYERAP